MCSRVGASRHPNSEIGFPQTSQIQSHVGDHRPRRRSREIDRRFSRVEIQSGHVTRSWEIKASTFEGTTVPAGDRGTDGRPNYVTRVRGTFFSDGPPTRGPVHEVPFPQMVGRIVLHGSEGPFSRMAGRIVLRGSEIPFSRMVGRIMLRGSEVPFSRTVPAELCYTSDQVSH